MSIPHSVIVLFAVLGAGALVVAGAAMNRFVGANNDSDDVWRSPPTAQVAYMRKVRLRNLRWAEREARRGGGG
ncbi:hypothetical protein BDR22DRAFT_869914 [Usnea florida]